MRSFNKSALLSAVFVAAAALPSASIAQGVTVQSVSDVRFQGALGGVMSAAARLGGASMHDSPSTTYLSGHKMRTESELSGSIVDLDAERLTTLDHKQKTFSSATFAEMAAAMQQASQSANQARAQEQAKRSKEPAKNSTASKDSMHVSYKVAVDRTGQHEKVAGYDAERVFITVSLEGQATPENGKTEQVGSMVFLMDEWISKSAPQIAAMSEFQRAYAQRVGAEFHSPTPGVQSAFSADPRMKDGFEAAAKELQKVQGVSLRNMTYVVLVPPDAPFDRQAVLNDAATAAKADNAKKDEKPKGGLGGFMSAVKAAAEESNKNQSDKDKKSASAKQSTLMVVVDEVKSIAQGAVAAEMFAPPAGYREVKRAQPR